MLFVFDDDAMQLNTRSLSPSHTGNSLKIKHCSCSFFDSQMRWCVINVNTFHWKSNIIFSLRQFFRTAHTWYLNNNCLLLTIDWETYTMSPTPAENGGHTPAELELMAKLKSLEEDRVKFVEIVRMKVTKLESERDVSVHWLSQPQILCIYFIFY